MRFSYDSDFWNCIFKFLLPSRYHIFNAENGLSYDKNLIVYKSLFTEHRELQAFLYSIKKHNTHSAKHFFYIPQLKIHYSKTEAFERILILILSNNYKSRVKGKRCMYLYQYHSHYKPHGTVLEWIAKISRSYFSRINYYLSN